MTSSIRNTLLQIRLETPSKQQPKITSADGAEDTMETAASTKPWYEHDLDLNHFKVLLSAEYLSDGLTAVEVVPAHIWTRRIQTQ